MYPKILSFVIVLALLLASVSAGQDSGDGKGTVILHEVPRGAAVKINDSIAVQALSHTYRLPPGRHHITVFNPFITDYNKLDYDTAVILSSGQTLRLTCRFRKLIHVESQPYGAEVFVNGTRTGETPLWINPELVPVLELRKKGFADNRIIIADSMRTGRNIFVTLERTESSVQVNQNLFKNGTWLKRNEKKYRIPLIASLTLSVLSGTAAAYSKKKADDYYEKAKLAYIFGDFEKQKRLEKKTRRYDRFATAGYIGLQVNITASVVFLFLMN